MSSTFVGLMVDYVVNHKVWCRRQFVTLFIFSFCCAFEHYRYRVWFILLFLFSELWFLVVTFIHILFFIVGGDYFFHVKVFFCCSFGFSPSMVTNFSISQTSFFVWSFGARTTLGRDTSLTDQSAFFDNNRVVIDLGHLIRTFGYWCVFISAVPKVLSFNP